jgi:hypothetical protein
MLGYGLNMFLRCGSQPREPALQPCVPALQLLPGIRFAFFQVSVVIHLYDNHALN